MTTKVIVRSAFHRLSQCFALLALSSLASFASFPAFAQDGRNTPGASTGGDLPPPDSGDGFDAPVGSTNSAPTGGGGTAGSGGNRPGTASANASAPLPADLKAKLGDYVELDDAIKNEMYGTIDFPNADLKDIVKAISKLANKNFILDAKINNRKITIISPQQVTKQEAYNAFLSALYMNDFTIVSMGRFLKIIEAKNAIQSNIRVFMGDFVPASEEVVTVLYPLKYLNADEIQRFLTDLVPRNGRISSYPNTNTLVMTDTGLNLRRIVGILKSIDVPGHEDQLENIQIRYASAKGIAALIDDILEAQSGTRRAGTAVRNQPQKTRGGGIITKIVPDERTNSLVVLANGRGVQELKNLVAKLDSADAAGGGNIHIYFCKNAVAEELAGTINTLISGARPPSTGTGNLSPLLPPVGNNNRGNNNNSGGDGIRFEGNIKVTFDKPSNSLVVVASGSDFAALKQVLNKLDVPRRQVYVEGTIMEISVANSNIFNMALLAPPLGFSTFKAADLAAAASNPAALSGLVGMFASGKTIQVPLPNGKKQTISNVIGLINAIQTSGQGNILHQPQILTSDNQDAEINVKTRVAVNNGNSLAATGAVSPNIGKEDVVIGLKITPQIGKENDLVKLKVEQQMDDFQPSSRGIDGQIDVITRKANTTVIARTGDTVVIGGLQKNVSIDSNTKLPLLGDIPILGMFFKGKDSNFSRSNLVLFLTPHIISKYSDLMHLTDAKIGERQKLGLEQYDPSDRFASDVKKFKSKATQNLSKPEPRGWGFSPESTGEPEDTFESSRPKGDTPKIDEDSASNGKGNSAYVQAFVSGDADDEEAKKRAAKAPPEPIMSIPGNSDGTTTVDPSSNAR